MLWIDWIVLILAILMISLIMLQDSKDDISDAFSGEKSELFKNQKSRGFERVLFWVTLVVAVLFIVTAIIAASKLFPRL